MIANHGIKMITWAAILLLRGVEDGMTHQDGKILPNPKKIAMLTSSPDLHLIQAHLQSLERSHQEAASIHTVLSQRLESSMQAMHTPPDTSSALAIPGPFADDSWTIFDQEIMCLANPPWLFDDTTSFPNQKSSDTQMQSLAPVTYDSGLLNSDPSFASNAHWNTTEQVHALPSTLNRIFGNEN